PPSWRERGELFGHGARGVPARGAQPGRGARGGRRRQDGAAGSQLSWPPRPPVVVVVFDEFPSDDLLRPDGSIDAERFPNFAELASISTWFPNAHTVYDSTFKAVPAILDGRLPRT